MNDVQYSILWDPTLIMTVLPLLATSVLIVVGVRLLWVKSQSGKQTCSTISKDMTAQRVANWT